MISLKKNRKQRQQEKLEKALQLAGETGKDFQEATPKQILKRFSKLKVVAGQLYVLAVRVTTGEQEKNGDLDDQADFLKNYIEEKGGIVVDVIRHVGPGSDCSWIKEAKKRSLETGAVIVFEEVSRLIRHPEAHKNRENYNLLPREEDLRIVDRYTRGAILTTYLHPLASIYDIWAQRSKRGQLMKGKRGGRPERKSPGYKKRRKERLFRKVSSLRLQGFSLGKIAVLTGVKKSTIHRWLQVGIL